MIRNNFWKCKDEETCLVKGQHGPIVIDELFNEVQIKLDENIRVELLKNKILCNANLPSRGFLVCAKCEYNLKGEVHQKEETILISPKSRSFFEEELQRLELNEVMRKYLKKN